MTEEDLKERVGKAIENVAEFDMTVDYLRDAVVRDLLPIVQAAIDLAEAVEDERLAHSLYEHTPTDRGGKYGSKGRARQAWDLSRTCLHHVLEDWEKAVK